MERFALLLEQRMRTFFNLHPRDLTQRELGTVISSLQVSPPPLSVRGCWLHKEKATASYGTTACIWDVKAELTGTIDFNRSPTRERASSKSLLRVPVLKDVLFSTSPVLVKERD